MLANALYALGALTGWVGTVLLARCLMGTVGGPTIPGGYVVRSVGLHHRSKYMLRVGIGIALGCAAGPLLAILIEVLCGAFRWNYTALCSDTAPGWVMVLLFAVELVLVLVFFVEPAKPKPPLARGGRPAALDTRKLAICYVFCYTIPINIGLWEVNTVFQAVHEWGWSIEVSVGAGRGRWGLGGGRSSWMPRLLVLGCRDCLCPPLPRGPRPEVLYSQGPVADPNA